MPPATIVVLGGTGFVGHSVCERLVERHGGGGGRIVVPTRRPPHGLPIQSLPTVELVRADVNDDARLGRVLAGADAVVNLVAILHGSAAEFERVHVALPRRLAAACKAAGVRRLVHVSALGVGPSAPSNYLRSKTAGELVLQEAGLDLTILRPSVIYGARDQTTTLFARLQAVLPLVPLAGAQARFQPVWVEDVAGAVAACLERAQTIGQVIECAGPDALTLAQLVRLVGCASGHPRAIVPLPPAVARLQALLMELAPGTPLLSRDNLDSMAHPNVATGTLPGLESLGIEPAALAAVLPEYLGADTGVARLERWRARRP
jgi:NADH dehydrogenase